MLMSILKKQQSASNHLPSYRYHVTNSIIRFNDDRTLFVIKFAGLPFETEGNSILQSRCNNLNNLLITLGKSSSSRLAVWTYLDRFKTKFDAEYKFNYNWQNDFSSEYIKQFNDRDIFENEFYIAFSLKSKSGDNFEDLLLETTEMQSTVINTLTEYDPELLEIYTENEVLFSQVYDFLAYLYNGKWQKLPVTSRPANETIQTSLHHFGSRVVETHFNDDTEKQFSRFIDLKDFPHTIKTGILDPLLTQPFEFILCQSFTFLSLNDSHHSMTQQINKLASANDEAAEQVEEILEGKAKLASGEVVFGDYHTAIQIKATSIKKLEDRASTLTSILSGNCSCICITAGYSAPATFYSMFPLGVKHRPRPMPKTTRNLVCMFPMNNHSSGKAHGNPLGDGSAILPIRTGEHSVHHLNLHHTNKGTSNIGEQVAGHACIHGSTGTGKTTLQTTILMYLDRFKTKVFAVDKDGSMRGFIEASGGSYFTIRSGEPSGLNPFQLPINERNKQFLIDLVLSCARQGNNEALTAEDNKDVKLAVDNLCSVLVPFEHRRFATLLQSIPDRGTNCLRRRLEQWVHGERIGRLAYALDNPTNSFDWNILNYVGFDVSDFLVENHPATEPILSYLFHIKDLMRKDGDLMATVIEEYQTPIAYPTTAKQIKDSLSTGRRQGEFVILVSQSPENAMKSELLPAILSQTATKIFLPDPEAKFKTSDGFGYHRFGITEGEFEVLKSLGKHSRKFIIKQASQSCTGSLDLGSKELRRYIKVLAMEKKDFPDLEESKRIAGNNPNDWIPVYLGFKQQREAK